MKVAFVGHGFHLKYTKSSQFFIDLMKPTWPTMHIFAEEWSWARIPRNDWDVVVFFQQIPSRVLLDSTAIKNVVLVPMYDDCPHDEAFWRQYLGCSIVCFSKTLAELLEPWGHRVFRTQYFPPVPEAGIDWSQGAQRAFFWPRKPNLSWVVVKTLLGEHPWKGVHLHVTEHSELLTRGLTDDDVRVYSISRTKWFLDRNEMLAALRSCQVYFSPRRAEGIGMSFLEAMAHGLAVVAPNGATMNEYIVSGENGLLYDPENPAALSYQDAAAWGSRARQTARAGRERWLSSIPSLVSFLSEPGPVRLPPVWKKEAARRYRQTWVKYAVYLMAEPLRMIKRRILKLKVKEQT